LLRWKNLAGCSKRVDPMDQKTGVVRTPDREELTPMLMKSEEDFHRIHSPNDSVEALNDKMF